MNSHREKFRFHLEKTLEIVKCLKELNINVKEDEILNQINNEDNVSWFTSDWRSCVLASHGKKRVSPRYRACPL